MSINQLDQLAESLEGALKVDNLHKNIYATDASVYRKIPLAVAFPKNKEDLKKLIHFANKNKITLIPRTAGTSLAGQCVGEGLVVDISKHFTNILAFDEKNRTVTVEPGVIRDELNQFLRPFGLLFGPNTSTSNRCMIGGMVGNNSSGTTSIQYGVTRDKVISMNTILSDGNEVEFKDLSKDEFVAKLTGNSLEHQIYANLFRELSKSEVREEITKEFPHKNIHRRNNGYAVDAIMDNQVFTSSDAPINLSKLLCGSEGTLALTTDVTLQLDELPPKNNVLIAAHFTSVQESLEAVVTAMEHNLFMCELMDKTILDCTKNNREQNANRFFVNGDPGAILMLELASDTVEETNRLADALIEELKLKNFGYEYPKLYGDEINKAFDLRKAGLGLLGNIVGDDKAVACIEDTAVEVKDLPKYIKEFSSMMDKHQQRAVYYAHAGAGELHLRPILNLKNHEGVSHFRKITSDVTHLVKKYNGSMSGEHGDGIVRSEFIPIIIGEKNYELIRKIKYTFDRNNIFNKGKIVDPLPMDQSLRYEVDREEPEIETLFDFSDSQGILRAAEKCNGSGDCRKSVAAGGTMCPSYRATKNEKDSTRARANSLREILTNNTEINKFNSEELKEVFDLCLSCKACSNECPSNVDIAAFKAEFLYQYQKTNGISFRTKLFGHHVKLNKLGSLAPTLTSAVLNTGLIKRIMGVSPKRSIPKLSKQTVYRWYDNNKSRLNHRTFKNGSLHLFIDEFTNYFDAEIGIDAIEVLTKLGYKVILSDHKESGRGFISKGLLSEAKTIANDNIQHFSQLISEEIPLVGLEPSAILTFRDEYLRLADDREMAQQIAKNTFTIEEFFQNEIRAGKIHSYQFAYDKKTIKVHGHCQQKSLSKISATFDMLNIPKNFNVTLINSGCCGMAGSFGYEKEHYELSMQVGEDSLFPKIRKAKPAIEIIASGTSCRHQIWDGTQRKSRHPISIIKQVLK